MTEEQKSKFSPKEFLQRRRPEKFSDSVVTEIGILERPVLEHFLAKLNTRNQELQFEDFAKRLCEKVICPNLLEQTGPVAGGDGKTDTQTFPVSEQNQLLWFEGINDSSHKERWAFAVSTRVDWKVKCRQDVIKIQQTNRGYTQAFCITNQYAKSNQRSELEDSLKTDTGMDVRILDISWILDQIYKNKLEYLAIETLSMPVQFKRERCVGNNDYQKQKELDEITENINTNVNSAKITTEQVDYFLDVAILSAELDKPIFETQGMFDRAIKIAKKFGTKQQLLDAYYQYAWKAHFWLEDFEIFEENLSEVYNCAQSSSSASKWESVVTLITVHRSYVRLNKITPTIDIEVIEQNTLKQLHTIADNETTPSNALFAKTQLVIFELNKIKSIEESAPAFEELLAILKQSERLIGFPFDKIFNLVNGVDDVFGDVESYENLLDYLTEQSCLRDGEVKSAMLQLKRGIKRLDSRKPYQAIKLVGKSLTLLYKEESTDQVILALRVISTAYGNVGLLWASRACMLLAASLLTDKFWKRDELNACQVQTYHQLCWIELKLGRLGHALKWYELTLLIQSGLNEDIISENDVISIEAFIGQLILNSSFDFIKRLENLPSVLDGLGLYNSSGNLLVALGYLDEFEQEYKTPVDDHLFEYLIKMRDFNFGTTPRKLNINLERRAKHFSQLLGCCINIDSPNRAPFIEFSEGILSLLEGAFATCAVDKLHLKEAYLSIEVIADDEDELEIHHELDDSSGKLHLEVTCSGFDEEAFDLEGQAIVQAWFKQLIFELLPEMFMIHNTKSIERMIFEDGALDRSISFGACFNASNNVLGKGLDTKVKDLFAHKPGSTNYPMLRTEAWDKDYPKPELVNLPTNLNKGVGSPPESLTNPENIHHQDMSIQGLIKPRLWSKAKWAGVGFSNFPDDIPGLYLLFDNTNEGSAVFSDLLDEVGINNRNNRLRVVIVKGISVNDAAHYRMIVSENINDVNNNKLMTMISRINTMTPNSSENLERFLLEYEKNGRCYFGCDAMLRNNERSDAHSGKLGIVINNLSVRWAWEIGENDLDCMAIQRDDEPYIPKHIDTAPVIKLLNRKNS
ncbi:hypothetical protein A6E05_12390 [Aliivibrio sp. 1S165]|uniref:hypothetical protein n=1 Tax=unclassified Aliivibrio TaxID=2645654 RepID=UPI00080EC7DA|nr:MULTISPECIES: hypothetical protein [unclassified Aliivibrio]OCH18127.1 hypothetical protein A6E05_12390 [Aliivibrio sp. 1S165]OCH35504.1 hypothetical protein A6E06_13130 [Aliivibrio sp. 1S175]USN27197.1 hypothetical protein [synthetic construct]